MLFGFYKPFGVLSQFNANPDYPGQKLLSEFGFPKGLEPVGRLDMDSEGLLLLSDRKGLTGELLKPESGHDRVYLVQVDGCPSAMDLRLLREGGVEIKGYETLPCKVFLLDEAPELPERDPAVDVHAAGRSRWLRMEMREGKNRQVRRMVAKVDCPCLRLVRVRIGDWDLGDMKVGEVRMLGA